MFIPETIDLGESEKYILSIRIKPNEFMFSISEPNIGKNYCLRSTKIPMDGRLLESIKKIIFDFNFLTQEYLQTNVVFVSTDYEFVPQSFFDEKEKQTLFEYTHTEDNLYPLFCKSKRQDAYCNYGVNEELYHFLARSLYNPQFYHHTCLLTDFFSDKNKIKSMNNRMYLNFHDDMLDILTYSQSTLQHCLSYSYESAANQIYYILNVWEKSEYDQMTDQVFVYGKPEGSIIPTLGEYIRNINHVVTPSEIYLWSEDALKSPIDLLSLTL